MSDWKQHHADEAEKALREGLVLRAVDEFVDNMKSNYGVDLSEGLPSYGLTKVMSYVAQAARAQTLGFNPELLRLSEDEADEAMLRLAQIAAESGKPVYLILDEEDE